MKMEMYEVLEDGTLKPTGNFFQTNADLMKDMRDFPENYNKARYTLVAKRPVLQVRATVVYNVLTDGVTDETA